MRGRATIPRAFLLSLVIAGTFAPAAAASRPWTMRDALGIEAMDQVRISPDGTLALVHYAGSTDPAGKVFSDEYRLVRIDDGTFRRMPDGLSNPHWAPSGQTIAWLRESRSGATQIVLTDARGALPHALTNSTRSVVTFAWSPDGTQVAAVETSARSGSAAPRLRWLNAESDYLASAPPKRDVYLIAAATGAERRITRDAWSYGGPATDRDPSWSASGRRLALIRQPTPVYGDYEHAQYVTLDPRNGSVEQIEKAPFFAYPGSVGPKFAPAGDAVAYAHTWDGLLPSREDLYVGGRDLTASLDRDLWSCGAGDAQWQANSLVATLLDGVSMRLFRIAPAGGVPQPLTPLGGSVLAFSSTPQGRIAYLWSTPDSPPELYVLDPGKAPRRITRFGALHGLPAATTRYVEWTAADGRALHGQLTLPNAGHAADAPLLVEPHGGPQCADDASFSGLAQFLASNGYAYFRPDPRGSDGYGDWSYKAIVGNWGEGPMADDMAGIDAVLTSGAGRADRLFIEGGSYGGYLTSWIVTHSDRFKAAVAAVPVTDLLLEYALSESPNITRRFFGAKPSLDRALLARESPLTYAADDHTPLLLIVGLRDTRAPYAQTIEFYKALAESGAETRLLADAQAGHGPDDPQGVALWWRATLAWFAQHGGPAIPGESMPR